MSKLGRWMVSLSTWWWDLSRNRRIVMIAITLVGLIFLFIGGFVATGVLAAVDARNESLKLEADLRSLTPFDLTEPATYDRLEEQFNELGILMDKADSRLSPLVLFTWLPWVGSTIKDSLTLARMGTYLASLGEDMSAVFRSAWELPIDNPSPTESVDFVGRSLEDAMVQLEQAKRDTEALKELRDDLSDSERSLRYGSLIDDYLPLAQAVIHLSLHHPRIMGKAYLVYQEALVVHRWAADPLELAEKPSEVRDQLTVLNQRALEFTLSMDLVLRLADNSDAHKTHSDTREALGLFQRQVGLISSVSTGLSSLVNIADTTFTHGAFSDTFAEVVALELKRADDALTSAQRELQSLQTFALMRKLFKQPTASLVPVNQGTNVPSEAMNIEDALERMIKFTEFLQDFLGYNGPRSYLLVGQNPFEIRATGGFIGVVVQVSIDSGRISEPKYFDSMTIDPNPPVYDKNPLAPDGLYWYLWHERMLFRDSNWSPHFPSSAAAIANIFETGTGIHSDGVITGAKTTMLELIDVFGDVIVPELEEPLTRDVALSFMEHESIYPCSHRLVSTKSDRCFDEDLFKSLWDYMLDGPGSSKAGELSKSLRKMLKTGNMLIHMLDSDNEILENLGWNGAVPKVEHDFLMFVDSSLPGHAIKDVRRSWEYRVSIDDELEVNSDLRLRYDHFGPDYGSICTQAATSRGCYFNYFRVYIPPLAHGLEIPPIPLHPGTEKLIWGYTDPDSLSISYDSVSGYTEIGGYAVVEPGSIMTIPMNYSLSPEILSKDDGEMYEYRLLIKKQPGMDNDHVSVGVQIPAGGKFIASNAEEFKLENRWVKFDMILLEDTELVVAFQLLKS